MSNETQAKTMLKNLTEGLSFDLPDVDFNDDTWNIPAGLLEALQQVPDKIDIDDLTSRHPRGSGVFDAIMESISNHLHEEYESNRLTGAMYAQTYTACVQSAMQQAVEFLLQKDKAYADAIMSQLSGITAAIGAYAAKVQYAMAVATANKVRADYANSVLKLATEDKQQGLLDKQIEHTQAQVVSEKELGETRRAQTLDTRSDNQSVVGMVGKQKDVYTKQAEVMEREMSYKAGKLWSDAYISMKNIDEGLDLPQQFTQNSINDVLTKIKSKNNL